MNVEECIKMLKEFRKYNKIYKEENKDLTITITLEAKESIDKAIERLLTDYKQKCNYIKENEIYKKNLFNSYEEKCKELEKEKEKNMELTNSYNQAIKETNEENRRCMLLAVENQDLKEKNKKLEADIEMFTKKFDNESLECRIKQKIAKLNHYNSMYLISNGKYSEVIQKQIEILQEILKEREE